MAIRKSTLTLRLVNKLFRYDPKTGRIYRKISVSQSTKPGDEAGSQDCGYVRIGINDYYYYAQCIAWFIYYKKWPNGVVDHKNRDRSDNRITNLRIATKQQNKINESLRKDNSTGYFGVSRRNFRFWARITNNGATANLGWFSTAEEAARRYDEEARKLHGTFAKLNFPEGTCQN